MPAKTTATKFWIAFLLALHAWAQVFFGIDLGIDADTALQIVAAVSTIGSGLVWFFPNKPKE